MIYGDLQFFDIIIFAGVALFLIYRLKNILGKRTGFEKPPHTNPEFQTSKNSPETRKDTPELSENIAKLKSAYEKIEDFDHKSFLDGAKMAFETIINSFNKGDKKALKKLLTKDVFKSFEEAIDAKKTDPNYQFYSLNINSIEDVQIENDLIKISIKFDSEQFKDNDESTVIKKQDIWTFEKPINSKDPNWLLSST
tara:strand:- start:4396 stop:4983 length:588 start_codon:yes stop_codon:yes gene_type:complete